MSACCLYACLGSVPADGDVCGPRRGRGALPEVGHVEVGEGVVDEAVHGAGGAVHIQVHQPRDEVRREGDHERLGLGGRQGGGRHQI